VAKRATVPASFRPEKRPKLAVPDPDKVVKNQPLSWGYRLIDLGGKWGWRNLDSDHLDALRLGLRDIEGKKLHALLQTNRIKRIPVQHMEPEARERLKTHGLEEAEELYEIRGLPKKWRVWGLMERAVFCLLWWDEFHTACGPPPKGVKR
jgi:hypothetical protein